MKKYLVYILLATLFCACSPYALVNSETYNNADLADYKTFRIVTPDEGHMPPGMTMVTYYNIAAAIREQMVERGFVESSASPLLINIGITIHKELMTEPVIPPAASPLLPPPPPGAFYNGYYPFFMYPRPNYFANYYANAQVITGVYKEGVLTMDFVNMQEKLPLYSASVATIIENGEARFRNLSGIAQAVQVLFSKFPVKVLPQYDRDR